MQVPPGAVTVTETVAVCEPGVPIEAKPAPALPEGVEFARIDVTPRMRSASFGHTTTLIVPVPSADAGAAPTQFWVQYGKSTNAPARLFGPFPL